MTSFIDRCLAGAASPTDIDDFIDAWHAGDDPRTLVEAIGLNFDEYERWLLDPQALEAIVAARAIGAAAVIA